MTDTTPNLLEGLAYYLLPEGILSYFDLVDFAEDVEGDEAPYIKVLHLYLDERDNRPVSMSLLRPNGFSSETQILDFPVRARKTILHVRRRRWIDDDGKSYTVPLDEEIRLTHPHTRYSEEFALFLKAADGH